MNNIIHKELSDRVIGLALTVHHVLGPGLLESAYEEAMCWELRHATIRFERQKVFPLRYKGDYISAYIADLVVDNAIILELKAVQAFNASMQAVAGKLVSALYSHKNPIPKFNSPIHGTRDTGPSMAGANHQLFKTFKNTGWISP